MPSLAAFKRSVTVGATFWHEHHERPDVSGPRIVTKLRACGYEYAYTDGRTMPPDWYPVTQWPAAASARVDGAVLTWLRPSGAPWWSDDFGPRP